MSEETYVKATKAYKNEDFLGSRAGRTIRILCEYEEPLRRLRQNNVNSTILFFGSARAKSREAYDAALKAGEEKVASLVGSGSHEYEIATDSLERLRRTEWMIEYYDKVQELARRVTEWAMTSHVRIAVGHAADGPIASSENRPIAVTVDKTGGSEAPPVPPSPSKRKSLSFVSDEGKPASASSMVVCTGGGPGLMEAANKGASQVPGARNMGMGISLPFECGLNRFVSPELAFEFHYFFTRKYWMLYPAQALVACPGGFGTMDELFEVLTLKQTCKVNRDLPVVLFGAAFWRRAINFEALAEMGVISQRDVDTLFFTDSVDDAFELLVEHLTNADHSDSDARPPAADAPAGGAASNGATATTSVNGSCAAPTAVLSPRRTTRSGSQLPERAATPTLEQVVGDTA